MIKISLPLKKKRVKKELEREGRNKARKGGKRNEKKKNNGEGEKLQMEKKRNKL